MTPSIYRVRYEYADGRISYATFSAMRPDALRWAADVLERKAGAPGGESEP